MHRPGRTGADRRFDTRAPAVRPASVAGGEELDDGLDVVVALPERVLPALDRNSARDEPSQPHGVGRSQRLRSLREVPPVRVDGAEYHVVLEHELVVERAHVDMQAAARPDTGKADDRAGSGVSHGAGDELGYAGALDDDVWLERTRDFRDVARVVLRAQVANELRLDPGLGSIEHVDLVAMLPRYQPREQTDRTGAGDEGALVRRAGTCPDAVDLLPSLGEHAGGLGEHAELAEFVGDRDRELALERHEFGPIAVAPLDAPLGVAPVAAHVPLAPRTAGTGLRIGTSDDAGDEIAGLEAGASCGSGMSLSSALPGSPGITVIARILPGYPARSLDYLPDPWATEAGQ